MFRRALRPASSALKAARASPAPALRAYATHGVTRDPMTGELTGLPNIDVSKLVVSKTETPKLVPPSETLRFGHTFSDHMLSINWNSGSGWKAPVIGPYAPLVLDPSAVIFHYAPTLFEGMKAYRDAEGRVRLFRPDMNMARMNRSAARAALPTFNGDALISLIRQLVLLDQHWIPSAPGHSLYIRPTLIGTQTALGVGPSTDALLFVICSPVGPYYKNGFKPVSLLATSDKVRAWPGGTGGYKLGSNYVQGVAPQIEAAKLGYDQNLWLFGEDHQLTEVGTMNLFVVIENADGTPELITPPLGDMILPGVTRDSILSLARDPVLELKERLPSNLKVSERQITMPELAALAEKGKLLECFGAGTAAIVSPVERIGFESKDIAVPVGSDGLGDVARAMMETIVGIQLGKIDHPWSIVC